LVTGDARFIEAKTVEINLNDGGERVIAGATAFSSLWECVLQYPTSPDLCIGKTP
jgi:hypothetical protein